MHTRDNAIGVFDSGIGGLTVFKQLMQSLPHEHLIYFGDTARLPYGGKSQETIIRYSIENTIFLLEKNIKLLVVACNTASAYAAEKLRLIFKIPVIGVIEPGILKVIQSTQSGRIGILGTRGTVESGAYQAGIIARLPQAEIIAVPCPLLVPLVEEHCINHPATELIIKDYLKPLKANGVDTVLLGCTHYPFLRELIQTEMGPSVTVVDSATTCAEAVEELLNERNLFHSGKTDPTHQYFVSDDPYRFACVAERFLGHPLPRVDSVQ